MLQFARTPARRRRRSRTLGLAAATGLATGALVVTEVLRVWRRGTAPPPARSRQLLHGGHIAARETVQVLRAGYQSGPANELAVLALSLSFGASFALARAVTHSIRRGRGGFGNMVIGRRHIHHFVPGILLVLVSGATSIGLRREALEPWLALPFGAGAALIVDETALLIELEDVYWTERGGLSVDVGLGTASALACLALLLRLVRRGEAAVFVQEPRADPAPSG